jgi:hypothetical protein
MFRTLSYRNGKRHGEMGELKREKREMVVDAVY